MFSKQLKPNLELLREEYVLIQAWKKTVSYIRYHNWFSDTLALDSVAANLPQFIGELRERLQSPGSWRTDPLRLVPAPKGQDWKVQNRVWKPKNGGKGAVPLRPLAHVSLTDQVVATALMLCVADKVETIQGDPRLSVNNPESRRKVISYGNRLFCDSHGRRLFHRWGSAKLYRSYFQDYRTFLSRPKIAAEQLTASGEHHLYVVHADIQKFYDCVHPEMLFAALERIRHDSDDQAFYSLARSVLSWGWHARDETDVQSYAEQAEIGDFTRVALPQGLVASGFFCKYCTLAIRSSVAGEDGKRN